MPSGHLAVCPLNVRYKTDFSTCIPQSPLNDSFAILFQGTQRSREYARLSYDGRNNQAVPDLFVGRPLLSRCRNVDFEAVWSVTGGSGGECNELGGLGIEAVRAAGEKIGKS